MEVLNGKPIVPYSIMTCIIKQCQILRLVDTYAAKHMKS